MERLDQHRLYPPLEAIGVVAAAISTLLEADPQTSVRVALGDLDELREAVDCLETDQASNLNISIVATSTDDYTCGGRRKEACDAGESASGYHHRRGSGYHQRHRLFGTPRDVSQIFFGRSSEV